VIDLFVLLDFYKLLSSSMLQFYLLGCNLATVLLTLGIFFPLKLGLLFFLDYSFPSLILFNSLLLKNFVNTLLLNCCTLLDNITDFLSFHCGMAFKHL